VLLKTKKVTDHIISATSSRNFGSGGEFLTIFTFVKSGTEATFGAVNG